MPLKKFLGTKRIEMYDDELSFLNDESVIYKVQMSSEPKRNFVLVQMDNTIFKYDLITKELLFRWKTQQNNQLILYDRDDKLCTVSDHGVRLWDFEDGIEQPPSIWATEEFSKNEKVDRVFINEGSITDDKNKDSLIDNWFIVIAIGTKFIVYTDRLDRTGVEIDLKDESVTACCFSEANDMLFVGTSTGMIRFLNLKQVMYLVEHPDEYEEEKVIMRDPYSVEPDDSPYKNKPITNM